jgi:hypothetical protein
MTDEINENEIIAGGEVDQVRITFRVMGDNLDPERVTSLLGVPPTAASERVSFGRAALPKYS